MYFRSLDDLNRDIIRTLHKMPKDIDLVVGVPRSGLLVANLIALNLNLPLVDLQGFIDGRIFQSGKTRRPDNYNQSIKNVKKVLIVEDSVYSGNSLLEAKNVIKESGKGSYIEIIYFAAYVVENKKNDVDLYLDVCPIPRVFEWNLMHHSIIENSYFDLDGVLCIDPGRDDDDDGKLYTEFVNNAKPLFIPTKKINTIVTCRLEKYRDITERWLTSNNVKYDKLVMMNYSSKEERMKEGKHSEYKAFHYGKSKAELFIESSLEQAISISKISKKPVYCVEVRKMIYPNSDINVQYFGKPTIKMKLKNRILKAKHLIIKMIKQVLPKSVFNIIKKIVKGK